MLFWGGRGAGAFAENFGSFVDNFVTLPAALLVISPLRTSGFKLRPTYNNAAGTGTGTGVGPKAGNYGTPAAAAV
jgi:hypothetical protein